MRVNHQQPLPPRSHTCTPGLSKRDTSAGQRSANTERADTPYSRASLRLISEASSSSAHQSRHSRSYSPSNNRSIEDKTSAEYSHHKLTGACKDTDGIDSIQGAPGTDGSHYGTVSSSPGHASNGRVSQSPIRHNRPDSSILTTCHERSSHDADAIRSDTYLESSASGGSETSYGSGVGKQRFDVDDIRSDAYLEPPFSRGSQTSHGSEAGKQRPTRDLYARILESHMNCDGPPKLLNPDLSDSDSDSDLGPDGSNSSPKVNTEKQSRRKTNPKARSAIRSEEEDPIICAISESRSSDVVGVTTINTATGEVEITGILNDDKYTYRCLLDHLARMPVEPQRFLVLKNVIGQGSKSQLVSCLGTRYPETPVEPFSREHWSETEGLSMVDRFAIRDHIKTIRSSLYKNFYAACAFAAAMTYVRDEMKVRFVANSLRIKYHRPVDTMGIDWPTVNSLELLENTRPTKSKSSTLFSILDTTRTPQGRRLLRSTLLQPSTDKTEINARYDAVEELSSNEDLLADIQKDLKKLQRIDVERIISWMTHEQCNPREPLEEGVPITSYEGYLLPNHDELSIAERELNYVLMLKLYLRGVNALYKTLEAAKCNSLICTWVQRRCAPKRLSLVQSIIEDGIEEDATYSSAPVDIRNNRLWAIKAGSNSVLKEARKLYKDLLNDVHEHVESLNKRFNDYLGSEAELCFDNDRRYHLRFRLSDVKRYLSKYKKTVGKVKFGEMRAWTRLQIGDVTMINGVRSQNHYWFQTRRLIRKSRGTQLQADIALMQSDKMVLELKAQLRRHAGLIFEASEAIAMLDMICSFTQLSTTQNCIRPVIGDSLVLRAARNPILEIRKMNFTPNQIYSGSTTGRFQIITGGNMSGKSTYIKTVALIQILAQMGCFVPAEYASIPICDQLFSRMSTDDRPESNLGTFGVEMREMDLILRQATDRSLVIIDELGRGTSSRDGLAIALSMAEKLIRTGPRVFFVTHFTKLASLLNSPSNRRKVLNVHFEGQSVMKDKTPQITLPHTLVSGPVKNEDYGLDLARRFFPPRHIRNAEQIAHFLRQKQTGRSLGPDTLDRKKDKLLRVVPDILKQARDSSMTDSALASYLEKLKAELSIRAEISGSKKEPEPEEAGNERARPTGLTVPRPVLEKPNDDELREWKKRWDQEEKRVMLANSKPRSTKRPHSETQTRRESSRRKLGDELAGVPKYARINRGRLLKERLSRHSEASPQKVISQKPLVSSDGITEEKRVSYIDRLDALAHSSTPLHRLLRQTVDNPATSPKTSNQHVSSVSPRIVFPSSSFSLRDCAEMDIDVNADSVLFGADLRTSTERSSGVSAIDSTTGLQPALSIHSEGVAEDKSDAIGKDKSSVSNPPEKSDTHLEDDHQPLQKFQPLKDWYAFIGQPVPSPKPSSVHDDVKFIGLLYSSDSDPETENTRRAKVQSPRKASADKPVAPGTETSSVTHNDPSGVAREDRVLGSD
ncbi:muts domain V-domain-containing protein [Podospora appendiculata]|uniref:DNA mismatch repair protein MSH3 n=1 Tax=Podospora appendiculata TaxID=314037 RepID=A0AAE0XJ68_9PEZI|nr:muts domain V-domain-containing protein [Podospora appendiculata]